MAEELFPGAGTRIFPGEYNGWLGAIKDCSIVGGSQRSINKNSGWIAAMPVAHV